EQSRVTYPDRITERQVREVLERERLADSALVISIANQGERQAPETKIAISVPGSILDVRTVPVAEEESVWVKVVSHFEKGNPLNKAKVELANLAANKSAQVFVYYLSLSNEIANSTPPSVEVFQDGRPATEVPKNFAPPSVWAIVQPAIISLLGGLLIG